MQPAPSQGGSSDSHLVARLHAGDEAAMVEIYDRLSPIVYAVALRVLRTTGDAEDVTQEIFLQLWRNPHAFSSSRGSLAAWIAVIARHRAIDFLRRRRPAVDVEDAVITSGLDLESEAGRNLSLSKIRAAMESLSQEQRVCLEMAFFDGMTHSEIAEKTAEPLGTIKTRIRTALIAIRKVLATEPAP